MWWGVALSHKGHHFELFVCNLIVMSRGLTVLFVVAKSCNDLKLIGVFS